MCSDDLRMKLDSNQHILSELRQKHIQSAFIHTFAVWAGIEPTATAWQAFFNIAVNIFGPKCVFYVILPLNYQTILRQEKDSNLRPMGLHRYLEVAVRFLIKNHLYTPIALNHWATSAL